MPVKFQTCRAECQRNFEYKAECLRIFKYIRRNAREFFKNIGRNARDFLNSRAECPQTVQSTGGMSPIIADLDVLRCRAPFLH